MGRIYLSPPHLSGRELELVTDAIASNWIAPLGPHVDAFEHEFAVRVGCRHALALSSGTAALHLALVVAGVGRGDRVAVPSLTFAATANAVTYVGAEPFFIDCDRTWTIDPTLLETTLREEAAAGRPIKAVVTVDLYGQPCDYSRISAVCAAHNAIVIQDAAEALGSTYLGGAVGTQGALAAFSFNGNKIITTSGGGMLVSEREEWIAHARKLSTQARDPAPHYQHSEVGFNYRMSNLLAAVGRAQLEVLDARVAARRAINQRYREGLARVRGVTFLDDSAHAVSNTWLTCVLFDPEAFGADREQVRRALDAADIEARPVWKPMHLQPVYRDYPSRGGDVSAGIFDRGLCLPSGSALSRADQARIIDIVLSQHR